jgi:hypothetical protein
MPKELAKKKQRRIRIVKSSISAAIALTIILLGLSLAWFTSSSEVETDSFGLSADGSPFELIAYGSSDKTLDFPSEYDSSVADGVKISGGVKTSNTVQSIKWLMSESSNIDNYGEAEGVGPGESGVLTFSVEAKKDCTVEFLLGESVFGSAKSTDDGAFKYGNEYLKQLGSGNEAAKLVSGRILFFENYDEETGAYSGRITEDGFSRSFKGGDTSEVNIYWIWPNTFGQIALQSTDDNLLNREAVFADGSEEKTAFIKLMENYSELFFSTENTGIFSKKSDGGYEMNSAYKTAVDAMSGISGTKYSSGAYVELSSAYNNADQKIGEQIRYILLTLNAE